MLRDAKTSTKILVGFSIPIAIIIALVAYGYRTLGATLDHAEWVEYTHVAIRYGEELVAAMVNQETGERGYALTGIDAYLEPNTKGKQVFAETLARAKQHLSRNAAQVARLEKMEELGRAFDADAAAPIIAKRREVSQGKATMEDVVRLMDAGTGKRHMDALRAVAKEFTDTELGLLTQRTETARREAGFASAALIVGGVLAVLLAALATWILARNVGGTVETLAREAGRLTEAVREGHLQERADVDAVGREFRPVLQGMNETMDAFARPIATTSECLVRLARGDVPALLTEEARGDFNDIQDALNRCIESVNALVTDAKLLARAGVEGQLSTRADAARHEGDFRTIVQGMNDTFDAVVHPLTMAARCVDQIAKGSIPPPIAEAYRGDYDLLKRNLNTCIGAVNALVEDSKRLATAAGAGELGVRADASRHSGDFREIIAGVNDALERIVAPFRVMADYCEQISHGELPPRRNNEVKGDLVPMQASLNRCLDALSRMVADVNGLVEAGLAGDLARRIDADRHEGAFREALAGVNRTLDAVIAPAQAASQVLERLAARDLCARVDGAFQGDHARLKDSVNATAAALHEALAQVADTVEQVSGAASQIASSSQAVASGASEQAAAIEETSTSIESVASMTQQSADSAQQASALASTARTAAGEGTAAVDQLQAAMGKIKQSAESTSQIIKDVSDIAFQTNLLALNAAVEAARAGEAGRGFAVVAEEVRSLALRAKEAATKTEALIRESVKQAGDGESAATRVSAKLGEIAQEVGRVTEVVSEIAAAAKEQASGIAQVTRAVAEMDKVTQQNAASAEESSSAASELSTQADELAAMVGEFALARRDGGQREGHRTPRPGAAHPRAPGRRMIPLPA